MVDRRKEIAQHLIDLLDNIISDLNKSNDEVARKGKESINRGLFILGGVGLLVFRNGLEVTTLTFWLYCFSILVVTCLSLFYIRYFTTSQDLKHINFEKHSKKVIEMTEYMIVAKCYTSEILKTTHYSLRKINKMFAKGLKWINRLSVLLILLSICTIFSFLLSTYSIF